jgi:BON domain
MRLKRSVIGAAGALVLALAPGGAAAATPPKPPPPPPAEAVRLINDAALTVRARRQVNGDKELRPLNLGVSVSRGVAVVWGPMPSADVPRRVQEKLLAVEGITEVRCRMYVDSRRPKATTDALVAGSVPRPVYVVQSAKPIGAVTRFPTLERKEVAKPSTLNRSPRRTEAGLTSRPAATAAPLPPAVPDPGAALREAINKVQRSQARFQRAQVTLQGDRVLIKPAPGEAGSATDLAEKLRELPDIGPVVLLSE